MPMLLPTMDIAACPDLAVPAQVMRHVVAVESGANPYAIGVVGNRLVRQPRSLDEAVATVRMLEGRGYNFSVGASQVNRSNLRKFGLDDHTKAFDFCRNLAAGSRILADCYRRALGNWGKAFSCYYSGNFVTGFRDGYVRKVYESIGRGTLVSESQLPANAIPLRTDTGGTGAAASHTATPTPPLAAARAGAPTGSTPFVPQVRKLPSAEVGPMPDSNARVSPAIQAPVPAASQGGQDNAFVF